MTVGIMQPYFLPYIGYWQLLSMVDRFVIYDNIQYTKKGWINRNRFLRGDGDAYFTVPLKKASDFLDIVEREVAAEFDRSHMLAQFTNSYRNAPYFKAVFPVIEQIVAAEHVNLFEYVRHSLEATARYLGIATPMVVSSSIPIDHALRSEDKVLALCGALGADRYVNTIGGRDLYSRERFQAHGVSLSFVQARPIRYPQFGSEFVPNLSILDVMMFNSTDEIRAMLAEYDVV